MKILQIILLIMYCQNILAQYSTRKYDTLSTQNNKYQLMYFSGKYPDKEIYYSYTFKNLGSKINADSLRKVVESKNISPKLQLYYITPHYRPTEATKNIDSIIIAKVGKEKFDTEFLKNGIDQIDFDFTYNLSGKVVELNEISFASSKKINIDTFLIDVEKIGTIFTENIDLEPKQDSYCDKKLLKAFQEINYFKSVHHFLLVPKRLLPKYKMLKAIPKFDKIIELDKNYQP